MEKKIAYKGFDEIDGKLKCLEKEYTVGEIAQVDGELKFCSNGIHFCWDLVNVDSYYSLFTKTICEVEILGDVVDGYKMEKSCTNKLKIIRIMSKEEISNLTNPGINNIGVRNTGHCNIGNRNTGNYNKGNYNTGDDNTGHCNTGHYNIGNYNIGHCNIGNYNIGHCNIGNYNTGLFNNCNYSNGIFGTIEPKIKIFDVDTDMTMTEFKKTIYYTALTSALYSVTEWVDYTDEEKKADKAKENTGGYVRAVEPKVAFARWWGKMTNSNKEIIKSMPNFDKDKFKMITGIEV